MYFRIYERIRKIKVSPVTTHHAINAYRGVEIKLHRFYTLRPDGGERLASRCNHFFTKKHFPIHIVVVTALIVIYFKVAYIWTLEPRKLVFILPQQLLPSN
jgi:hypothetical protein